MKIDLPNQLGVAPSPVVLVSSGDMQNSNIATIGWSGIINSEPMLVYVSIRPSRFSNEIITKTREFVINLPDEKLVKVADFCGTKSGREVNKFEFCGLTKKRSSMMNVPYIEECPINLECQVVDIQKFGSHEMFVAKVVCTHCEERILDEKEQVNFAKANLLTFGGKKYFAGNREVGVRGCGVK